MKPFLLGYFAASLLLCGFPYATYGDEDVTSFVNEYCRQDYEGVTKDRTEHFVKFSPMRKKYEEETHEFSGKIILWDWDPLFVVDSFKVGKVEINSKDAHKGTVIIQYARVARSDGKGVLVPDPRQHDKVLLNLICDEDGWWVLDPPPPRISRTALARIYQGELSQLGEKWLANSSDEQMMYYRRIKRNIEVLK